MRNKVSHLSKLAYIRYRDKRIQNAKNKSKVIWQVINGSLYQNKKKSRNSITKIKNSDEEHVSNSHEIANTFNDFFVNIGKKMADKIPECENRIASPQAEGSLVIEETNPEEIMKLIDGLDINKSCREDDIPIKFIKLSSSIISGFLSEIFNKCIKLGVYPNLLKVAK